MLTEGFTGFQKKKKITQIHHCSAISVETVRNRNYCMLSTKITSFKFRMGCSRGFSIIFFYFVYFSTVRKILYRLRGREPKIRKEKKIKTNFAQHKCAYVYRSDQVFFYLTSLMCMCVDLVFGFASSFVRYVCCRFLFLLLYAILIVHFCFDYNIPSFRDAIICISFICIQYNCLFVVDVLFSHHSSTASV